MAHCNLQSLAHLITSGAFEPDTLLLSPRAAADVMGVAPEEVQRVYDSLVGRSLLERSGDGGYRVSVERAPLSINDALVVAMLRDVCESAVRRFGLSGGDLERLAAHAIVDTCAACRRVIQLPAAAAATSHAGECR
ncbi:hypothetical protein EPN42_13025 [bacterium]|nr:MAG: hypothetical protein EPN42_13025 [bacterium]